MGSDRRTDERLTPDDIRAALTEWGWIVMVDDAEVCHIEPKDKSALVSCTKHSSNLFMLTTEVAKYRGVAPSTLSDLRTLLRLVGAPVPERRKKDEPGKIPCKVCGQPLSQSENCGFGGHVEMDNMGWYDEDAEIAVLWWRWLMGRRADDAKRET